MSMQAMAGDTAYRALVDHFYEYDLWMKKNRFLYYCRDCVRNFGSEYRVGRCTRCNKTNIVELPNDWVKPSIKIKHNIETEFPKKMNKMKKNIGIWSEKFSSDFSKKSKLWLFKTRIAFFYFTSRANNEEKPSSVRRLII